MKINSGCIQLTFGKAMTLQDLQQVVDRASELNIPEGAVITFVSFNAYLNETTLTLNWRIDGQV